MGCIRLLYAIQAGHDGLIKIGHAANVLRRLGKMRVDSAQELKLLGVLPGGPMKEREVHHKLRADRVRGEWFSPTPAVLAFVGTMLPEGEAVDTKEERLPTTPKRRYRRVPIRSEKVDTTAPAYVVVDKFGGLAEFCRITGWPSSTVHDWLVKGLIPADRQARVLELARDHRKAVKPADFVPVPSAA
jgi:hypothetical protein